MLIVVKVFLFIFIVLFVWICLWSMKQKDNKRNKEEDWRNRPKPPAIFTFVIGRNRKDPLKNRGLYI